MLRTNSVILNRTLLKPFSKKKYKIDNQAINLSVLNNPEVKNNSKSNATPINIFSTTILKNPPNSNKNMPIELDNFRDLVDKYDNFIFDLDGVLWCGSKILKNTFDAIKSLQNLPNKKIFFLTNANRATKKSILKKMQNNDLNIKDSRDIYTSSYLIANYISEKYPDIKRLYAIGREGLLEALKAFNIQTFGGYEDDFKKIDLCEPEKLNIDNSIQGVICGFDDEINYYKLLIASQLIKETNFFFGTNHDKEININGKKFPGPYSLISALETSSGKKATIISKPNTDSLDIIFKENKIEKTINNLKKTLMIGDNLNKDIGFANNSKIDSLLVLTGVTTPEKFQEIISNDLFGDFNNQKSSRNSENFSNQNAQIYAKPTYYMKEIKLY